MRFRKIKLSVGDYILSRCKPSESGCIEWTGALSSGYGRFKVGGKAVLAHRALYAFMNPCVDINGLDVCHSCDNRKCCNIEHLFHGTRQDNMADCVNKGRHPAQNGHHVQPKYDRTHIPTICRMRKIGMSKREIAKTLNWPYKTLLKYDRRHGISQSLSVCASNEN